MAPMDLRLVRKWIDEGIIDFKELILQNYKNIGLTETVWLNMDLVTLSYFCRSTCGSYNTIKKTPAGLQINGLASSAFARHYLRSLV